MEMERRPARVMRTFEAEKEEYDKFKSTLAKDDKDIGETIRAWIRKFNLEYGDGNPGYSLDPFIKDAAMKAVPAVFRNKQDWYNWLLKCTDEKLVQDVLSQAQLILGLADNRILALRGHTVI